MVFRPVFSPTKHGPNLFEVADIEFRWNPGFAPIQKQKNIAALHEAAKRVGFSNLLEVSTKSDRELGRRLSAFSLKYNIDGESLPLESVYQSSKVFRNGGPFEYIVRMSPIEAKKEIRKKNLNEIIYFQLNGIKYNSIPFNAFYDWIYLKALSSHESYLKENLIKYDGFTDIEFNPAKSINCQARALAILMSLIYRNKLQKSASDFSFFRREISSSFKAI